MIYFVSLVMTSAATIVAGHVFCEMPVFNYAFSFAVEARPYSTLDGLG
jgi:hypothetical protein